MEQVKKQNKIVNILVNVVFSLIIILTIFISVTALTARANNGVPNLGGKSVMNVLTDSMSGTIEKGDLIFIELLESDDAKKRDQIHDKFVVDETIATFRWDINGDGNKDLVTHRLVAKNYDTKGVLTNLVFQGDKKPDDPAEEVAYQVIPFFDVVGVYTGRLAGVGAFIAFLQTSNGFLIVFVIPLFLYFCYQGYKLFSVAMEVKRENAVQLGKLTDAAREEEKRRIREEILREMDKDNKKDE